MTAQERVAVVTGGNRGIGLGVCRGLARAGLTVVLTSRRVTKGRAAQRQLAREGLQVDYQQLDVTQPDQSKRLCTYLKQTYGRLDVLVNNAGILDDWQVSVLKPNLTHIRWTMETNVYGPLHVCHHLVPLMRKHHYGRIVNLSSGMGQLCEMNGQTPGYRLSKTAINAVTRMLADELHDTNILVNSMCPGWVQTEMGGAGATRTIAEGADTAIWLATLPADGPRGGFFRDRQPIPW